MIEFNFLVLSSIILICKIQDHVMQPILIKNPQRFTLNQNKYLYLLL